MGEVGGICNVLPSRVVPFNKQSDGAGDWQYFINNGFPLAVSELLQVSGSKYLERKKYHTFEQRKLKLVIGHHAKKRENN